MYTINKLFLFFNTLSVLSSLSCFSQNDAQKSNKLITMVSNIDSSPAKKKIIPIAIPITEVAVGQVFKY